ncbi:hypothetical protein OF117_05110 [Geodermatophilus sp. YIM 151500]|uniref:hypothetical protein n=1 Tax=Geodermatophilus sp. YIM 151500 TaxID=2984531 RepID=UPI0021E3AE7E|nr:hypothetical protein [Geodermatophilus sp. YIM 151500]MCV2488734.1 hypothetical protein [Geodermatophilus sp. YIM 151500]
MSRPQPLRVVVSAACPSCARARALVDEVRRLRPGRPVELVDVGRDADRFAGGLVGTPTWFLGNRLLFLGNPDLDPLLATLDGTAAQP